MTTGKSPGRGEEVEILNLAIKFVLTAFNCRDSMAAPHVTGVVALMFEAKGNMTFDAVKNALLEGTTQDGRRPFPVCEPQLFKFRFPNNEFCRGILNAKNTLLKTLG